MDHSFDSPAVLSICPGILGIERGLKRAGINPSVVAYVEIEAFIIENLVTGMESGLLDPAPIWTDIKTFDGLPFRGKIHGIIGGYPCTPFSLTGGRSGENHPGHLWPYIFRTIETTKPVWCFFENVDDHLTLGFDRVSHDLRSMGYAVEAGVFTAEEVGAPHERARLFILAILADTNGRRFWRHHFRRFQSKTQRTGEKLGYTESVKQNRCFESRTRISGSSDEGKKLADDTGQGLAKRKGQPAREKLQTAERGNLNLADAYGARKQIQVIRELSTEQFPGWPAPQDVHQYEWEEPRTVESGVGCTVNGYNYREDFLRALGNSVVEQTAEIAFKDLIHQHSHLFQTFNHSK